jgi:hypothetical protein
VTDYLEDVTVKIHSKSVLPDGTESEIVTRHENTSCIISEFCRGDLFDLISKVGAITDL